MKKPLLHYFTYTILHYYFILAFIYIAHDVFSLSKEKVYSCPNYFCKLLRLGISKSSITLYVSIFDFRCEYLSWFEQILKQALETYLKYLSWICLYKIIYNDYWGILLRHHTPPISSFEAKIIRSKNDENP